MSINTQDLSDQEEIDRLEQAIQTFIEGRIDPDRFTAVRLQQGVYGQRQDGVNMLRIKIPGGRLNADQLDAIADVTETYSQRDIAHLTTRQSIQVHFIPLAKMPSAMRRLALVKMTSREACGNTVRNMSACALSGVCPREHVDVAAHIDGATRHFLRNPLNQQMPRKFKISFSGCESDCAQSLLHDAGVIATNKDGQRGFKVKAGGGLGHKPRESIVVEEFIPERELLFSLEALVTLHNKYSDRTKRAKSQIPGRALRRRRLPGKIPRGVRAHQTGAGRPALSRRGMARTNRAAGAGVGRAAQAVCAASTGIVCVSGRTPDRRDHVRAIARYRRVIALPRSG